MRNGQVPRRYRPPLPLMAAVVMVGLLGVGFALRGPAFLSGVRAFLEFYAGVFALVGLSIAVMAGLACTDRLILSIRLRVLLQDVHRSMGVFAVGSLVTHVSIKVIDAHASILDALVPWAAGTGFAVGLGTIGGGLMVLVAAIGAVRIRYLNTGRPWMWRLIHCAAYVSWPVALIHGLTAGRQPKEWVVISYQLCLAAVGIGLLLRLATSAWFRGASANGRIAPPRRGAVLSPLVPGQAKAPGADDAIEAEFWAALRKEVRH